MKITSILQLLKSSIHEERFLSLIILIERYEKADNNEKRRIYNIYLKNIKYINNWDLIDTSAPKIVGSFILNKNKKPLYELCKSSNLWKRRVAIVSCLELIKHNQINDTFRLTKLLLKDKEDLIHKACGWMLREAGKKNISSLENFIISHKHEMPRVMLRYAIEKFPKYKRKIFLKK